MVAVYISREIFVMKENNSAIIEYYEKSQSSYDLIWMNKRNLAMHYGFWDKDTKNLHEALINENKAVAESLDIKKGDIVLDAGCGVGGTAIWIAENYGVKVVGINIVEKQIKLAKKYAKDRGVENLVDFHVRDFCKTGFADGYFTKIYGVESICHANSKEKLLKELFRVLKPAGRVVVADSFLKKGNLSRKDKSKLDIWCEGWAVPNVISVPDFKKFIVTTGYKSVIWKNVNNKIIRSARRIYIVGCLLYPFDWMLNKIGLVSKENFNSTRASFNQYYLFKKIMNYSLVILKK